ncbi:tumor necrosis factor ligand superfamily member 10 [Pelobates fuscus]|uniref:tumor necrosis factor ligand superfamily member 10 n=1 Tax=Pelobates fuscus TaxID=191477 RepID=UPI002FE46679
MSSAGSSQSSQRGLILLIAVLLQCVFVAVTYVYFTNELKQLRENDIKNNIACLIGDNMGNIFQPVDFKNIDTTDPCWGVRYQLQTLIKKIVAKQYKPEMPEQGKLLEIPMHEISGNPSQITAAHVTGTRSKTSQPAERSLANRYVGQKIAEWKSYKQPSFLTNIEINNGELVIKKSGFYYIYSQTYFRQQDNTDTEKGIGTELIQYIYKVSNYPNPILLMKNIKTACWSKNAEYALNSIYQGGVYKFNENDRIFVAVSDFSLVDMDEQGTYFGAFLLF